MSDDPDLDSKVEIRKTADREYTVIQHTFLLDVASQTSFPTGEFVSRPYDNTYDGTLVDPNALDDNASKLPSPSHTACGMEL